MTVDTSAIGLLLVDDEAPILRALRRTLRRAGWQIREAASAEDALVMVEEDAPDIILSDVRMPGIDGIEFLRRVRETHPDTVRVILTGYSQEEQLLTAFRNGDVHEVVTKPWDDDVLRQRLGAIAAQLVEHRQQIHRLASIVQRMDPLPQLSSAVDEVRRELASAEPDVDALAAALAREPSLAAKILQVANSTLYGQRREVETLRRAIVVIGLRSVATLSGVSAAFLSLPGSSALKPETLWRHSVRVGEIARQISARQGLNEEHQEEAAIAGLLHDIGKLAFSTYLAADHERVCHEAATDEIPLYEAERRHFGCHHAMLGGYLTDWWQFPLVYGDILRSHHEPSTASRAPVLAAVIHVADALAHRLDGAQDEPLDPRAMQMLSIDENNVDDLIRSLN